MKKIIAQIPNTITSLNLVSGVAATMFAIDGHLVWAAIFICLAAVLDFMDGFAARLLKAYSEIGKELDSLADVVSFGVAPGAILFTLLEFSLFGKNQPIHEIGARWYEWLILSTSFLLPVFGAIRLARFNTNTANENFFRGLPIPANGLFWAAMGLMLQMPKYAEVLKLVYSVRTLVLLGIFMAGVMVITMPMFSLKAKSLSFADNWYRYLFAFVAVVLIAVLNVYGLALVIFLYILLNAVFYLLKVKF
ncbi:MAG TPA: CDP-diacylglycerol--serine O-phosphatidyltransferase [Prolixibacteraceae bacterium]|nr:CDP-diacylglycerol--serine O-phosphatidyltransferase [Prolixibacteraceae bacterium]